MLCRLEDIPDPGSLGFKITRGGVEREIFAIRKGLEVFVYANVCPHRGMPLNWKPDIFLCYDKSRILCVMHACTFEIETGQALTGPCPGQSLEAIAVTVTGGAVRLAECPDMDRDQDMD